MNAALPASDTLGALFRPRSVALIGASDDPARISGRPLRYLKEGGFQGAIYPVNPKRAVVQGLKSYASITDLPEAPDVAMLAVSAGLTRDALRQCAEKGVKAAVLFSAGYAETGADGAKAQAELLAIGRASGMRLLGPNCLGIFNSELGFYGTFSNALDRGLPKPGPLAVASQSGAYGAHVAYLARMRGMGVRYCITTGNEADVDVAQGLLWLARQPDVEVIMAYTEGVRDADAFLHALGVAHENRKPVIFMKVGTSVSGSRAVSSHTAALAGADAVYDAVFRQYGVHRARTTDEQLDVAYACARGIHPAGNKIGIVSVSGGGGVQLADAAERHGLDVAPMPAEAQKKLKAQLPFASVGNPIDATAHVLNDMSLLVRNFEVLLDEGGYDAHVGYFTTTPAARPFAKPLREAILQGTRNHRDKLMALCMVADPDIVRSYEESGFLVFEDTERAAAAIAALVRLNVAFNKEIPLPGKAGKAQPLPSGVLSEHEAKRVLAEAGIPMLPERLVTSAAQAADAGAALGFPVAMKIVSPDIAHKTEIGGVLLGVADAKGASDGFEALGQRAREAFPQARIDGVLVAPMAPKGVETIVGVSRDPTFGPVVMFGLGGILVEVLKDVTLRLAPFGEEEALRMIREVKGHALLEGVRGAPRSDIGALARTLAAISRFAAAHAGEIESIDLNPFLVLPEGQGAVALDALIVKSKP